MVLINIRRPDQRASGPAETALLWVNENPERLATWLN